MPIRVEKYLEILRVAKRQQEATSRLVREIELAQVNPLPEEALQNLAILSQEARPQVRDQILVEVELKRYSPRYLERLEGERRRQLEKRKEK